MALSSFHPVVARWFTETLGEPTPAQARGWASIRAGRHTLIAAPTGSGKTLAAFLAAIDDLVREGLQAPLPDEVRVVYVSPLKALSADIHKNLAEPRRGISERAAQEGLGVPRITSGVRTGDTTAGERAKMLRTPPHILVTTPESLYLLLTSSRGRAMLRTVRTVIVDEIHAVIGGRRGAHLALSLERLQQTVGNPIQRIGLSATQKPIEDVAAWLVGCGGHRERAVIVDEGHRRALDLAIEIPRSPLEAVMAHDVWAEYYDRLTALVREHRTTLIFVNTRKMAERVARCLTERLGEDAVTAHHGSLSKATRLDAEHRLKTGALKALVATASLELGIDIGHVDLVCQIGSPRRIATLLQRVGRSGHTVHGTPKGRLFPETRDDLIECAALVRCVRQGQLDCIVTHDCPLDVLAQQLAAEVSCCEYGEDELFALVRQAWPYRALSRNDFDAVLGMLCEGFATRRGRRSALLHRDEVHQVVRARRGTRGLAVTSGGAIPEVADYRVVLEPDETFVGTLNEDFAIESTAGDIFQLGNTSWQIRQVVAGTVRVTDAHGAPPTIPFWLGEAPARSDELSAAVADMRRQVESQCGEGGASCAAQWLSVEAGLCEGGALQAAAYLDESLRVLGALPTQDTLILERFFDESGGMQLVLHAPFGSRIMRAWALALRKRFCRQFNFELQAAATDDALLLSLGPQHSFPLADVFRYLHPASVRDILVQAFLDAPVFATRWRWNATVSLAVPRNRNGTKVPPQLQRMRADDLMAAVFPDAAACLENIPGDREIPDHPLVAQTVRDCLEEAMDLPGLASVLERVHAGTLRLVSRDTPEPSPLAHAILNARPFAFLDDAPLEERRAHAVQTRRGTRLSGDDVGRLDAAAIARVRDEERPDPRDAEELHDALLTAGWLLESEFGQPEFAALAARGRAARVFTGGSEKALVVAAERLPEMRAVHPGAKLEPPISPPPSRATRTWTRGEALVELLKGRLSITGPMTAAGMALSLGAPSSDVDAALLTLEAEGTVLRGSFSPGERDVEWCDRRLLARIHRYTLDALRAEIAPVTPSEFMRFLFAWQHVAPATRLTGPEGLRAILQQLDGLELPARAWESDVLPVRLERYEPAWLDLLCLTGDAGWARLSSGPTQVVGATPVAIFLREHADIWFALKRTPADVTGLGPAAYQVLEHLVAKGASFSHELRPLVEDSDRLQAALAELVAAGAVASDGFSGLRGISGGGPSAAPSRLARGDSAGRWSALIDRNVELPREAAVETLAWTLLRRYGVVFRRLLARETDAVTWRELAYVYRRLEARGEIRGGRFVSGMSGEQFALMEAVESLRETRRTAADGRLITICAADPLNLTGIITPGDRIRAVAGSRIVYRDGVPVAAMEGDSIRQLGDLDASAASAAAAAAAGRRVPVTSGYVGRMDRHLAR